MFGQTELSSSINGEHEDQIEKDAEKAYKSLSREARVVAHLVTGVDDEEFEQVWEEESCRGTKFVTKKCRQKPFVVESKKELSLGDKLSTDNRRNSVGPQSGLRSPSSLAGFQTVSLTALPSSRLQIVR